MGFGAHVARRCRRFGRVGRRDLVERSVERVAVARRGVPGRGALLKPRHRGLVLEPHEGRVWAVHGRHLKVCAHATQTRASVQKEKRESEREREREEREKREREREREREEREKRERRERRDRRDRRERRERERNKKREQERDILSRGDKLVFKKTVFFFKS